MWEENGGEWNKNYPNGKYAIVYQLGEQPLSPWSWEVNDGTDTICQGTAPILVVAQALCDTCATVEP